MRGVRSQPANAYADALRRLARRDHSEHELRRALGRRGHDPEETEAAIERLRRERALDDDRFASRWAASQMEHHGLGRHRVRQALAFRGIPRAVVAKAIARALRDVPETEVLDGVARRYWARTAGGSPTVRVRRLWALLLRRGFPADLVARRLRHLLPRRRDEIAALADDAGPQTAGDPFDTPGE
jgi:regulatory protein